MQWIFYVTSAVTILSALLVVSRHNPVHALLYMIVTLLSLAMLFLLLGAAFAAALEIIVYAGAIMVLMVFVIMMLNQGASAVKQESEWLQGSAWIGPGILNFILLLLLLALLNDGFAGIGNTVDVCLLEINPVDVKQVGISLFGPYVIAVELASFLLLSALVGGFHLCRGLLNRGGPRHD